MTVATREETLRQRMIDAGYKPDLRQKGWPLAFATFPVQDYIFGDTLGRICEELKEYFISQGPRPTHTSKVRTIVFSPILASSIYPGVKTTRLSYSRKDPGVHIWVRVRISAWKAATSRARRRLLVTLLTNALQGIRESWLSVPDKKALCQLLASYLRASVPSKQRIGRAHKHVA
jgi:hypothetical protein